MTFIINIWLHCYTKDKLASSLRSLLWLLWDQWHFLGIRILPPSTLSCILIILLYKVAEQGFLTRLLARCFQYFQPLWLPGGFPPGAPRGGPAHSSAGQQRVLREGGSCWCLWAPHPDVFTQRWIQVNAAAGEIQAPSAQRPRAEEMRSSPTVLTLPHSGRPAAPGSGSIRERTLKKTRSRLLALQVRLRASLWENRQNRPFATFLLFVDSYLLFRWVSWKQNTQVFFFVLFCLVSSRNLTYIFSPWPSTKSKSRGEERELSVGKK